MSFSVSKMVTTGPRVSANGMRVCTDAKARQSHLGHQMNKREGMVELNESSGSRISDKRENVQWHPCKNGWRTGATLPNLTYFTANASFAPFGSSTIHLGRF